MKGLLSTSRALAVLARLDDYELRACERLNASMQSAGVLRLLRVASRAGDGVLWYTLIVALAAFGGLDGRRAALGCALAGATGLATYRILKNVLVRERPFITHRSILAGARPLDRFSFPSGHTLHAVNFTILLGSAVPAALPLLIPVALLIALSRVVLGLHYPSDVLAGALIGAGIAGTTLALT